MVRGLLKAGSALAIVAASVAISMPANAADYGGDCCADLEERVAELEATAVKHGNRKVSMTIGGSVTYAIIHWDNGTASDTNVIQPSTNGAGFSISGSGALNSDITVGYNIGINARAGKPNNLSGKAGGGDATVSDLSMDTQSVYISSASMGKVTLGSGVNAYAGARNWDGSTGDAMAGINAAAAGAVGGLGDAGGPGIGYESPSLAGFTLGVSWGRDDTIGARLGYAASFSGNSVSVGVGYQNEMTGVAADMGTVRYSYNGKISNDASGIFVQGAYEQEDAVVATAGDKSAYQVKAGWSKNVNGLGNTSVWGVYTVSDLSGIKDDKLDEIGTGFGVGLSQGLDAVGANLFVRYDQVSSDKLNVKDASTVLAGMTVNF